ncbi:MAG: ABC transporter ATP-binding protein [Flaviflexus sp.]|uniref:ABC transporter ATP-binding protein n=1 Tax=Flaviflexus sp. TaxID=1969482 RepID=UPI00352CFC0F
MISVQNLTVRYGEMVAVNNVDLTVDTGEILALLGPSGCGKSSLLRGVVGLEPAMGEILVDNRSVQGVPVHQRNIGMVFQDAQLFTHRTVAGNIAYGLKGKPKAEIQARVGELLRLVGMEGMGERAVTTLSGGQAQRVALARSLAPRPSVLLLDEPLSALDRVLRERLSNDLRAILKEAGATAIYVTHDHDEAFTVADRVGIMDQGVLVQVATPEELLSHPTAAVSHFLGSSLVVDAEVVESTCEGTKVTLPEDVVIPGYVTGGSVRLRIKPLGAQEQDRDGQ